MKRGISLVALMSTVVILLVLVSSITVTGVSTMNKANMMSFATELKMIQDSLNSYNIKSDGALPIKDAVIIDLSKVNSKDIVQFDGENIVDNKVTMYEIDYDKLDISSLKHGINKQENDIYVYSKDTGDVYYAKGNQIGGNTYFKLVGDLEKSLNSDYGNKKSANSKVIIFETSSTNWTREAVTVNVKIPIEYTVSSVKVDDNKVEKTNNDELYNIYECKVNSNSDITVSYLDNGVTNTTKYSVTNIDTEEPVLSIDKDNQKILEKTNGDKVAYINIIDKKDNLSGIKTIKYESYKVTNNINEYFENNGTKVTGNNIVIKDGTMIVTVYAEDYAGNWIAYYVDISSNVISTYK